MIEITIRVKPGCAARVAELLRRTAAVEPDRGQARALRGAARRLERLTPRRPARQATAPNANTPRPHRYTPRVQRPRHQHIDERAVQRVVLGEQPLPLLTRAEARLACWYLTQRACSAPEIASRVRVAQRTVHRWRAEDRQAATS
ncbi:MAG TPA: hypothetical protein VL251_08450 [Thermomonas sp.]|jgi:hypothetical protein|nr:hypothetical protein [Thermomonas sp.]